MFSYRLQLNLVEELPQIQLFHNIISASFPSIGMTIVRKRGDEWNFDNNHYKNIHR